jgi:hypothetical protein
MVTKKILLLCIPLALAGCNEIDASTYGGYGDYGFRDVHGRARSEAALQADERACELRTGHGAKYRNCLAAHGWRFARTPTRAQRNEATYDTSSPTYDTSSSSHDAAADNAAAQQISDEANAATAQTAQGIADTSAAIQAAAVGN